MPQTWGVPVEEIQRGIKHGVRKINIDTDNRMAITGAIRKVFAEQPGEFDPRKYLKPASEAMKDLPPALRRIRRGRPGREDQGHRHGVHGQALCRRANSRPGPRGLPAPPNEEMRRTLLCASTRSPWP